MNKKLITIAIIAGIFIISYFAYNHQSLIYKKLYDLKLIPLAEHFTELYFENYPDLPTKIIKGQPIKFSFTINNLEGKDLEYPYRVYFKSNDNQTMLIDQKKQFIKNGEHFTINESYIFKQLPQAGVIKVELERLNQAVHFLLANK